MTSRVAVVIHDGLSVDLGETPRVVRCPRCARDVTVDVPAGWQPAWAARVVALTCPRQQWVPRPGWRRWLARVAGYRIGEHEKVVIR